MAHFCRNYAWVITKNHDKSHMNRSIRRILLIFLVGSVLLGGQMEQEGHLVKSVGINKSAIICDVWSIKLSLTFVGYEFLL